MEPEAHPLHGWHWEKLILPDGKVLWGEDAPEPDKLEALRHKQ